MTIEINHVSEGDIIEGDRSWRINAIASEDHHKLTIGQNFRKVVDHTSPVWVAEPSGGRWPSYPSEDFVDMNGPEVSGSVGLIINGTAVSIAKIATTEGISVRDKRFVVVMVENTSDRYEECPRLVTARQLTADDRIDPQGLTIQFQQSAPFMLDTSLYAPPPPPAEDPYIHQVNIIGRMALPKP